MRQARPLPDSLVRRYRGWRATTWQENRGWYRRLAAEGQRPRTMVIACCDSRVPVTAMFGAEQGEFFIHRNVASLVPRHAPGAAHQGASAAVEYAVATLRVSQVVVLGHSRCGGVEGCHDMCLGEAPELAREGSFVGRWLDILRPGWERVRHLEDREARLRAFERVAVLVSLENLMTYPFVAAAVERGELALHGLWHDIAEGTLEVYDPVTEAFRPL